MLYYLLQDDLDDLIIYENVNKKNQSENEEIEVDEDNNYDDIECNNVKYDEPEQDYSPLWSTNENLINLTDMDIIINIKTSQKIQEILPLSFSNPTYKAFIQLVIKHNLSDSVTN